MAWFLCSFSHNQQINNKKKRLSATQTEQKDTHPRPASRCGLLCGRWCRCVAVSVAVPAGADDDAVVLRQSSSAARAGRRKLFSRCKVGIRAAASRGESYWMATWRPIPQRERSQSCCLCWVPNATHVTLIPSRCSASTSDFAGMLFFFFFPPPPDFENELQFPCHDGGIQTAVFLPFRKPIRSNSFLFSTNKPVRTSQLVGEQPSWGATCFGSGRSMEGRWGLEGCGSVGGLWLTP